MFKINDHLLLSWKIILQQEKLRLLIDQKKSILNLWKI